MSNDASGLISRFSADVGALTAIHRPSASPGEEAAAHWVRSSLGQSGLRAEIEPFRFNPDYGTIWAIHGLTSAAAAILGLVGRRPARIGAALGALAATSFYGEVAVRFRLLGRLLPGRESYNVLAKLPNPEASQLLIVSAHHDAARSGAWFHPALLRALQRVQGTERDLALPVRATLASMIAVSLGALAARRGNKRLARWLLATGGLYCLGFATVLRDIARSPVSPGANDDASGVAVLLALADALAREPPPDTEVWFLSTGSEEGVLGGMQAFVARHRDELARRRTTVLNLEILGSGRVAYLEGEGLLSRRPYEPDVLQIAEEAATEGAFAGIRGLRSAPFLTDAYVAGMHGIPAITILSLAEDGSVPGYHWPNDTLDNLDLRSLEQAYQFSRRLIALLAERGS